MEIEKIHQEAYKQYPKMSRVSEWREKPLPAHFNSEYLGDANAEKREGFIAGAKWAEETMIDKACEWLNEHILDYVYAKEWGQGVGVEGELFDDFKNAMKGE